MSLVAYDSSDESDEDISPKQKKSSIFVKNTCITENKKQRESVKITIPSLKEFEEEENDEVPKKKPKFQSGSGLFSILPPPKNSTTLSKPGFVPHILKSKKEQTSSSDKQSAAPCQKLKKPQISSATISSDHDSDDDISHVTDKASFVAKDFFSLDNSAKVKDPSNNCLVSDYNTVIPESSVKGGLFRENHEFPSKSSLSHSDSSVTQKQECKLSTSYTQQPIFLNESASYHQYDKMPLTDASESNCPPEEDSAVYLAESVSESDDKESLLNDKEFLKLQGRRREFEGIDFIDVNAADQLTDKNEWLMKSLTEESTYRPSRKKHNMPTQQQKRKHQITYLAFQAKEREMDLKNQWALNSRTRRETQAKYGF